MLNYTAVHTKMNLVISLDSQICPTTTITIFYLLRLLFWGIQYSFFFYLHKYWNKYMFSYETIRAKKYCTYIIVVYRHSSRSLPISAKCASFAFEIILILTGGGCKT